jgi:nucleoside-diphosphate-sugar epimerase
MILLTGISGLTGKFLYEALQVSTFDKKIRYFVRKNSDISWIKNKENIFYGELSNIEDIKLALKDVETVFHLAPRNILSNILLACETSDVKRFFYVNSTGVYSKFKSSTHSDIQNEILLKESGLIYTIIRPSMIYGNHQDGNIHLLVKLLNKFPIFPIVGEGKGLMHPIYAKDLAILLLTTLLNERKTRNKEYDVAGKHPIAYKKLLSTISEAIGKKRFFIHIPYSLALFIGRIGDYIPNRIISYEKILRLEEDKHFDYSKAKEDLSFSPLSFEEAIHYEVKALYEKNII